MSGSCLVIVLVLVLSGCYAFLTSYDCGYFLPFSLLFYLLQFGGFVCVCCCFFVVVVVVVAVAVAVVVVVVVVMVVVVVFFHFSVVLLCSPLSEVFLVSFGCCVFSLFTHPVLLRWCFFLSGFGPMTSWLRKTRLRQTSAPTSSAGTVSKCHPQCQLRPVRVGTVF